MRRISEFRKDEGGMILVFVAMFLVVIVGMTALTFDLGRMASTQTDLQAYADHVALAAAGELDGENDAITRANAAAANMIRDRQSFADGDRDLDSAADYSLRFLTGLPSAAADPDDNDPVDAFVTTDPAEAGMVEVTATPRTVFLPFARALAGLLGVAGPNEQVSAVAIAGYAQYACDIAPLMFCVPPNWTADANKGSTINLRTGGSNAAWEPGNFGFLDPEDNFINPTGPCAGLTGSKLYICLIAANGPITKCVQQNGVDTEVGQRNGIASAIYNSRFDMFSATMNQLKNDPDYAPGPQVISGWDASGGACLGNNPTLSTDSMPFPPDDCFASDSCGPYARFGDANWANGKAAYLDMNYGDGPDGSMPIHSLGNPSGNTRYEMYMDEIARSAPASDILEGRSESGRPQCASTTVDDPSRRTFIAAAIDCANNPIQGRTQDVPVKEFVKIFLIQPLESSSGSDFDIYVEVVEKVGGAGGSNIDAIFRDVVRLYR